jgi:hypothetical protein
MLVEQFDGGALHAAQRFTVFRPGIEHGPDGHSHGPLKVVAVGAASVGGIAQISHLPILPRLAR